jgi:hypothetical protein
MLDLFQSIFRGGEKQGLYPESLIEAAIERAVDGTDPRLRALPGYRKNLRPSILNAISHVVALVDGISAHSPAGRGDYSADPRLKALFASVDRMLEVFGNDASLRDFLSGPGKGAERVYTLLLAERVEKNILGMELAGDLLRRDVQQVSVSFRNHRLVEPSAGEEGTRRLLKKRAFDHLLTLALTRIAELKSTQADLVQQRDLLGRKLNALKQGGWSFDLVESARPAPETLVAELQDIETELSKLGADAGALQGRMDVVVDVLGHAEQQLWAEELILHLDNMNIRRDEKDSSAHRIALQELHNARGARLALLLVSLNPGELPQRESMISVASRYLI